MTHFLLFYIKIINNQMNKWSIIYDDYCWDRPLFYVLLNELSCVWQATVWRLTYLMGTTRWEPRLLTSFIFIDKGRVILKTPKWRPLVFSWFLVYLTESCEENMYRFMIFLIFIYYMNLNQFIQRNCVIESNKYNGLCRDQYWILNT